MSARGPEGVWLGRLLDYQRRVARRAADRLRGVSSDLRTGRYDGARAVSDLVGFWGDLVDDWWSVVMRTDAGLPLVRLTVERGTLPTEATLGTVLLPAGGSGVPTASAIARADGSAVIPATHVRLRADPARSELEVGLRGLRELTLPPGLYGGLIFIDTRAVAAVEVSVVDPVTDGAGP